jgi:sugar phosphate isomerase/epimerase
MDVKTLFPQSRLLLSAGTLPKARFIERVDAAQKAGFDAIALFPQQYLRARKKEKLTPADMREILAERNVTLDEVDPLLDWFGPTASHAENLIFEIANELGARSINTPPAFAPAIELQELTAALVRVCERANSHGLRVDLEFLPWTLVPDLRTALQVVDDAGQANLGITLDVWHFFRGGDTVATLHGLNLEEAARITNLQVNDAPATRRSLSLRDKLSLIGVTLDQVIDGINVHGARQFFKVSSAMKSTRPDATALMTEASSARLLPGEGDMALADWLAALDSVGCKPTVGVEIFSLELSRRPAAEVAARSMAAYRSVAAA